MLLTPQLLMMRKVMTQMRFIVHLATLQELQSQVAKAVIIVFSLLVALQQTVAALES